MEERGTIIRISRSWIGVYYEKVLDAFLVYIGMCMSGELVDNVIIGGALCLLGQVLVVFIRLYSKQSSELLPRNIQARGIAIFLCTTLLSALLLFIYPAVMQDTQFFPLLAGICILLFRQAITDNLAHRLRMRMIWRMLALSMMHLLFLLAHSILLSTRLSETAFHDVMTMLIATAFAALAYQSTKQTARKPFIRTSTERLLRVSSYRVYNRMTSSTLAALNLALISYICYMQLEPRHTMLQQFWNLVVWLMLLIGVTWLMLGFLKRSNGKQYDKPSTFAVGAVMIVFAIAGTYRGWFRGIWLLSGYLLWGFGLACMFSIIINLGADLRTVLELDMPAEEAAGYQQNTQAVVEWELTLSTLILLIMLTCITFMTDGTLEQLQQSLAIRMTTQWLLLLPPLLIMIALVYALAQPLNKDYARKLARYHALLRAGNINPALEMRLQLKLIKQTRQIAPAILRAIIRPLMPCKVVGAEHVDDKNGPVVFICNHKEVYGPIITNLHLPFYFRSWIISGMLDPDIVAKHLENGVENIFYWVPKKIRKRLPRWISPIALHVLHAVDPIPVYRGNMREVRKTLCLTVDAMEYEDNILIFPENPDLDGIRYRLQGISPFYSGFASIGSEYYKRTGNCTTFYPMYANRTKRTLTIGEGVRYSPENPRNEEKERIVHTLYDWMCLQANYED